jgi:hypothetical protein
MENMDECSELRLGCNQANGLKNVVAMQEGMFAGYFGSLFSGVDGCVNAAVLVNDGFVVSTATYRLHNMVNGAVAYEMAVSARVIAPVDEFSEGLANFTGFLSLEQQEVTTETKSLLKQHAHDYRLSDLSDVERTVCQARHVRRILRSMPGINRCKAHIELQDARNGFIASRIFISSPES